jgi:pimeloyl-ACP methyl ester carboxylesterase
MSIASGFAEVNHSHLYYEIAGAGDPIVFLNAGGLDCRMWDAQ